MKLSIILAFTALLSIPVLAQGQVAPTFENCTHIATNSDMQICFDRTIRQHVLDTLKYPSGLEKEGMVLVKITFDEKGQLQEPEVMKSFSEFASNEALKVMKSLPRVVVPATQNGTPVAISYTFPVQFKK